MNCDLCGQRYPENPEADRHPGACWSNAQAAVTRQGCKEGVDVRYVEGWVVRAYGGKRDIAQHGWVERDGIVEDVTPCHHVERYFPVLRWTPTELGQWIARLGRTPVLSFCRDALAEPGSTAYSEGVATAYAAAKVAAEAHLRA